MSTTLEDLRRLTLEQQKQTEGAPVASEPEPTSDAQMRASASKQVRKRASKDALPQALAEAGEQAGTEALAPASAQASESTVAPTPNTQRPAPQRLNTPTPEHPLPDDFVAQVREAIAQKRVHPGGIKASVDMSADLSLRAKRYCLDHGSVPVRLVFIELLAAFLEAEGY